VIGNTGARNGGQHVVGRALDVAAARSLKAAWSSGGTVVAVQCRCSAVVEARYQVLDRGGLVLSDLRRIGVGFALNVVSRACELATAS